MRIDVVGRFSRRLALAIAKRASDSRSVVRHTDTYLSRLRRCVLSYHQSMEVPASLRAK
jgi:hypothetical protein